MRIIPILFNTEMVQAILAGRKTVTRRLVKPKSKNACGFYVTTRKSDGAFMGVYDYDEDERMFDNSQTPPACIGDILYVRETWMDYAGMKMYKADCDEYRIESLKLAGFNWHPSLHMPKEAARIFLKVTDVRVERLQDVDATGCLQEGIKSEYPYVLNGEEKLYAFSQLWDSTIKNSDLEQYGWDANPWVWVIEFERCERPAEF